MLKQPSIKAPNRKNNLKTFTKKQKKSRQITKLEKDKQLIVSAMRKKMSFSRRTGQPIRNLEEQLIELPLALCDSNGIANKGQKSYATKHYEARYSTAFPPVFASNIPWTPEVIIMEGMFLINVNPLNQHKKLQDYCKFIMERFIKSEFRKGCNEIHVIFDNPGSLEQSPKYFEQKRRDQEVSSTSNSMHYCDDINGEKPINYKKWREEFLKCRQCKRSLVIFLGNYLLQSIQMSLQPLQVLYVAGCFKNEISNTAWFAKGTNKPQPDPNLYSNAEESDSRIWLHATKAEKRKILVQSPDTDVYHIGLPLTCISSKEVVIQLSSVNSQEVKIINLSKFALTLKNDPDMVGISCELVPKIMQTIYIATGCNYISFFNNLGKSTFLKYFFEYSSFITAGTNINTPGMLSDTEPHQQELGYYSFLRLVGVVYFKKHASGFSTSSPVTHFNSIHLAEADYKYNHIQWLNAIRMNICSIAIEHEEIFGEEMAYEEMNDL